VIGLRTALLWDAPVTFQRYVEDCGASCDLVTPQLCAAPFYRGSFSALIVPTGFANPAYSRTLVALRATSDRIRRYLERGGTLLVFGAAIDRADAYDWLPFRLVYRHGYGPCRVDPVDPGLFEALFGGYDTAAIECDGWFEEADADVIATAGGRSVAVSRRVGDGFVVATTVHEYPARTFLSALGPGRRETLF
jgi:hypothetical protein